MAHRQLWERATSYAAVGATKADDLMTYPPRGYRPITRRARIGHGEARFAYAATATLTWGIQRGSGFRVRPTSPPSAVTDLTYTPVVFDAAGEPVEPSSVAGTETAFGPDGTPLVVPGDTAWLVIPVLGPIAVKSPVRVVYIVDEAKRRGFAYGTLPGHPEDGEESFVVEMADDGSVWLEIRAFSRPANLFWWCGYPILRIVQEHYTRRYLRALAGPLP